MEEKYIEFDFFLDYAEMQVVLPCKYFFKQDEFSINELCAMNEYIAGRYDAYYSMLKSSMEFKEAIRKYKIKQWKKNI